MTWRYLFGRAWLLVRVKWWVWRQKRRSDGHSELYKSLDTYYKGRALGLDIPPPFSIGLPIAVGPQPEDYPPYRPFLPPIEEAPYDVKEFNRERTENMKHYETNNE